MLFYTFSSVKLCLIDGLDGPKSLAPGVIIGWTFISTVLHYFEIPVICHGGPCAFFTYFK